MDFKCMKCSATFKTNSGLGRHLQCIHPDAVTIVNSTTIKRSRRDRTFQFKRDVINEVDKLSMNNEVCPIKRVAHMHGGLDPRRIGEWMKNRSHIFTMAHKRGYAQTKRIRPCIGLFTDAEQVLYEKFCFRRLIIRKSTSLLWLKQTMRKVLNDMYPEDSSAINFKSSSGWVQGFLKRWDITRLCRTNTHKLSFRERLPQVQKYHRFLIYQLQRSEPQRCIKYGRFPPGKMWSMDQTPIEIGFREKMTYNPKGFQCDIRSAPSDCKRLCTAQVWICADPTKFVNLEIIFKGLEKTKTTKEMEHYASLPNVTVRFQRKAWADESIMVRSLAHFREQTINDGEVLLIMDNHGSQKTPYCRSFMEAMYIIPAYTPPNCTDILAPCDHHVQVQLKILMHKELERRMDNESLLGLCAQDKRMLVAEVLSLAWASLCTDYHHLIRASFIDTGKLVAKDGSEWHRVVLEKSGEGKYLGPDQV